MVGINILRTWSFHPNRGSYLVRALIGILGLGLAFHFVTSLQEILSRNVSSLHSQNIIVGGWTAGVQYFHLKPSNLV